MTNLPNSAAEPAANTTPDLDDTVSTAVPTVPPADASESVGDGPVAQDATAGPITADLTPEPGADATEPGADGSSADTAAAETVAAPEPGVDTVPVVPLVGAVTVGEPPAPHRRKRSLAVRFGVAFVFGVALAAAIGVGALYAWGQEYDGRVLPGVQVGDTDLGGLTREQAGAALVSAYGWLGDGQITLTGPDGQSSTISYGDLSRGPDTPSLLDTALAAGRHTDPITNLITAPRAALNGVTLDSAVMYDRDKLSAAIDGLATSIDQTPMDATVARQGRTFTVSAAKDGRAVDKSALLIALDRQLSGLDTPASIAMNVPMVSLPPAVATASAEAAKAAADRMAADLVVARGKDDWTISGKRLAPLISFSTAADGTITPVLDESGLDPLMKTLAKQVNRPAQDAGLKLMNGRVFAVGTSHEGRTLKTAAMKAAIITEIGARQAGATASPVEAAVKAVDPKLTTAAAKAFAGKMRPISSFSVYYWVIINNHWGGNIEAPATAINGTVVPAGTIFDFWKVVGDLRRLPGTGPGNAIEGGKITVTGAFGGGICTTSTTLFNAAFRAGMVPLARQNHNEFINRYPPGLDATVWIVGNTKQTMSFKNDTKYPILIQRVITHAGNKRWLTFKIWSVPNSRKAVISNTVIKHGPRAIDTVVRDPTKPVGYRYRNNAPADGAKVWTTVTIYDHGKVHWTKRYYSRYPAVNGVLVVGTKT